MHACTHTRTHTQAHTFTYILHKHNGNGNGNKTVFACVSVSIYVYTDFRPHVISQLYIKSLNHKMETIINYPSVRVLVKLCMNAYLNINLLRIVRW